jgi:hypothetical protein
MMSSTMRYSDLDQNSRSVSAGGAWLAGAAAMFAVGLAGNAQADMPFNVNYHMCGGTCSEGHDNTACVCETNAGADPSSTNQNDYYDCYQLFCCDYGIVWTVSYEYYLENYDPYLAYEQGISYTSQFFTWQWFDHIDTVGRAPGSNATFENETGWDWGITRYIFGSIFSTGWHATDCTLSAQSPWDDQYTHWPAWYD